VGNPGTVTLSLRSTLAGVPDGGDLVSGTIDGDDFSTYTGGEWYEIPFTENYTVTSGTTYALVVRATAGGVANYVNVRVDSAGDYDGGQRCQSADSGVTWAATAASDIIFAVKALTEDNAAYRQKLLIRLDPTEFGNPAGGLEDLADRLNLSYPWMTSLIWMGISIWVAIAGYWVTREDGRVVLPVLTIMMPIGGITGFMPWVWVAMAMFFFFMGLIYTFTWGKSSI